MTGHTLEKQGLTTDDAVFDNGEPVFFVTTETEQEAGRCRIIPCDEMQGSGDDDIRD